MDGTLFIFMVVLTLLWLIRPGGYKEATIGSLLGMGGVGFVVSTVTIYFAMPKLQFLPILITFVVMLGLALMANGLLFGDMCDGSDWFAICGLGTLIGTILILAISGVFLIGFTQNLAALPNVQEGNGTTTLISNDHIRLVGYETALWRADKAIGDLGYKVGVYEPDIQMIDDELTWLVPLDFNGDIKALTYAIEGTEGYVMVSAEDPKAGANLITGVPMRYTPNAIFDHYLQRHIYLENPGYGICKPVFQLDDQGNPKWVVPMTKPAYMGFIGEVPVGVVVVNPVTGGQQRYSMGEEPAWVQRTWDEEVVERYMGWWGSYRDGWINSWWGQRDVKVPTGSVTIKTNEKDETQYVTSDSEPDVYLVAGTDGNLYWFSALTNPKKKTSMVGYMLVDVKSGEFTYYRCSGYYNDIGAAANVQQHPEVAKARGLQATQPIMYVIEGKEVWIIPVISQTGENMGIGLVNARTGETHIGETYGQTLSEMLNRKVDDPKSTGGILDRTVQETIDEIRELLNNLENRVVQKTT